MVDNRVTLRTRHSFATRSNKQRVVRTPGNKLVVQKAKKVVSAPKCRVTGQQLHGLKVVAGTSLHSLPKRMKTVTRPYGGNLCGGAVRQRIVSAFLKNESSAAKAMAQ